MDAAFILTLPVSHFSWRTIISSISRTISTRSLATAEPGIAESGWTNGSRENRKTPLSVVPEHFLRQSLWILHSQYISCSEMRGGRLASIFEWLKVLTPVAKGLKSINRLKATDHRHQQQLDGGMNFFFCFFFFWTHERPSPQPKPTLFPPPQ